MSQPHESSDSHPPQPVGASNKLWDMALLGLAKFVPIVAGAVIALAGTVAANTFQMDGTRQESVRSAAVAAYSEATAAALTYSSLREQNDLEPNAAKESLTEWRVAFQSAFAYGLTEDDTLIVTRLNTLNGFVKEQVETGTQHGDVSEAVLKFNVALCKRLDPSADCVLLTQ